MWPILRCNLCFQMWAIFIIKPIFPNVANFLHRDPFFHLWHAFPNVNHILFTVSPIFQCDSFTTVWSILYSDPFLQMWFMFLQCGLLFQIWNIFFSSATNFLQCNSLFSVTHFSVWPIFHSVTRFSKCSPNVLQRNLFFTVWPISHDLTHFMPCEPIFQVCPIFHSATNVLQCNVLFKVWPSFYSATHLFTM